MDGFDSGPSSAVGRRPTLRVATHLAPGVLPAYALIARRLGELLERPAELVVAADYRRCAADVDHVCFVCSVPFLLLADAGLIRMELLAAPVLRGRRYGGAPVYYSDVVVRADAGMRCFDDLRGRRWAYNEPYSHSGYIVVLHHLAGQRRPEEFLVDQVESGFHDESLRMVLDGRADWSAIDTQVLEIWLRQDPSIRKRLRVVGRLGPSTIQPVVISSRRLCRRDRETLRGGVTTVHRDPLVREVLAGAGIDRFVPVGDADYDDIRRKLATVMEAGLLPPDWRSGWDALAAVRRVERVSGPRSPQRAPARPRERHRPQPGHPRR